MILNTIRRRGTAMRILPVIVIALVFVLMPAVVSGHMHESHCDDSGSGHNCGCVCFTFFMDLPAAEVTIELPLFAMVQHGTQEYSILLESSIFKPPIV